MFQTPCGLWTAGGHIDQINNFYGNLSLQTERASVAGDPILIVGDLNAKLGKGIIKGDIHEMSSNWQKLHNLIIKYNLNVVNSMEICFRTFTRANNKIVGEKTALDYVIVSDELIDTLKICRSTLRNGLCLSVPSKAANDFLEDDNAIILKVEYSKIPSQFKSDRETV